MRWRMAFGSAPHRLKERLELLWCHKAALHEFLADLLERLLPEVAECEQLLLLHGNKLTHLRDVVRLETVERAHRQLEILDGHVGEAAGEVVAARLPCLRGLQVVAEAHEEIEMLGEQRGGLTHRLNRRQRAIGPHLDDEAIPLRLLPYARLLDRAIGF